ncbi:hypothetical protein [Actinokineospora sp.]|uniref:hypothetical protein n=1 Tax=Actinokineospora sp. TaxID=1872133 RepID=UPI004037E056
MDAPMTLTGTRVRWRGLMQVQLTKTVYQAESGAGDPRPPGPGDVHELAEGDEGVIGELVRVDPTGGHVYVIRWDAGVEMETDLPSPLVAPVLAEPAALPALSRRYADIARPGIWARTRTALRRTLPSAHRTSRG